MSELKLSTEEISQLWFEAQDQALAGFPAPFHFAKAVIELQARRTQPEATKPAQDLSAAIPYGWLQFIDGVKTQNFARDEKELSDIKMMFRLMKHTGKAEYLPVYASQADALVAGDSETSTSDSENCAHLTDCPGCDKCEALLEHYMACDECGSWGNKEANGWTKTSENQFVCESCAAIQAQKDGHG